MPKSGDSRAIDAFRRILGASQVLDRREAMLRYGRCTTGRPRRIAGALLARRREEIVGIVRAARRLGAPLYPISTGHNWGLGSASPVVDGCIVVDLSALDRIVDFEPVLGLVTVEPGVT